MVTKQTWREFSQIKLSILILEKQDIGTTWTFLLQKFLGKINNIYIFKVQVVELLFYDFFDLRDFSLSYSFFSFFSRTRKSFVPHYFKAPRIIMDVLIGVVLYPTSSNLGLSEVKESQKPARKTNLEIAIPTHYSNPYNLSIELEV